MESESQPALHTEFRIPLISTVTTRHEIPDTSRTPHTAHRTPHTAHRTPHTAHRTPHTAHRDISAFPSLFNRTISFSIRAPSPVSRGASRRGSARTRRRPQRPRRMHCWYDRAYRPRRHHNPPATGRAVARCAATFGRNGSCCRRSRSC
ncbi:hypothetical protein CFB84_40685 [Burkholderia aenigmatica]|uniref:Uncharacterized protein n=1 Tax=Burkholderia aenigmatica TaxID=2015348 RepID=A0A228HRG4_9BURK|nr:hypothetical protein CFB84_40685 [Burkholderia aenigmatica]